MGARARHSSLEEENYHLRTQLGKLQVALQQIQAEGVRAQRTKQQAKSNAQIERLLEENARLRRHQSRSDAELNALRRDHARVTAYLEEARAHIKDLRHELGLKRPKQSRPSRSQPGPAAVGDGSELARSLTNSPTKLQVRNTLAAKLAEIRLQGGGGGQATPEARRPSVREALGDLLEDARGGSPYARAGAPARRNILPPPADSSSAKLDQIANILESWGGAEPDAEHSYAEATPGRRPGGHSAHATPTSRPGITTKEFQFIQGEIKGLQEQLHRAEMNIASMHGDREDGLGVLEDSDLQRMRAKNRNLRLEFRKQRDALAAVAGQLTEVSRHVPRKAFSGRSLQEPETSIGSVGKRASPAKKPRPRSAGSARKTKYKFREADKLLSAGLSSSDPAIPWL